MLKLIIRVGACLTTIILLGLIVLQVLEHQDTLPYGTSARVELNFNSSGLTPDQSRDQLESWARSNNAELYLLRPGSAEQEVNLYALGVDQPTTSQPLTWLDPGRSGALYPATAVPEGSLSGTYLLSDSGAEQSFRQWLDQAGIQASWAENIWLTIFFRPLVYLGAALTIVGAVVLLVSLITSWYASRAEHRAIRVLAGMTTTRIQVDDARVLLANIAGSATLTGLAGLGLICVLRGLPNALAVLGPLALGLFALIAGSGICGVVLSLITWPQVRGFAERRPPALRFELVNQVSKGLSLALALAAVPILVTSISDAAATAASASRARQLQSWMSVSVGGVTLQQYEQVAEGIGAAIGAADQSGDVAFSLHRAPGTAASAAGYDSMVLSDERYFTLMSDPKAATEELSWDRLTPQLRSELTALFDVSLRQGVDLEQVVRLVEFKSNSPVLAQSAAGQGMVLGKRPLVLVTPHISALLNNDSLASYITSGNVIFSDRQTLLDKTSGLGLILTFSPAANEAILYAQAKASQLYIMVATVILLALSTITALLLSGSLFAVRHSRRLFPLFLDGVSIDKLLSSRMFGEATLMISVLALVSAAYLWLGFPSYSLWLIVTLIILFAVSWLIHRLALRHTLIARSMRRI